MATYQVGKVCEDAEKIMAGLIDQAQEFDDLKRFKVTISVMFAYAKLDDDGNPDGPALKLHGYEEAAIIKINSYKDRVEGKADATLFIDGDRFGEMTARRQEALIHHYLTYLEVKRTKMGDVARDDCGRPKLRLRLHSFQIGVFKSTMEKYGADSLDFQAVGQLVEYVQMELFPRG